MASAVPATESAWNVGVSVSRRSRAVRRASAATWCVVRLGEEAGALERLHRLADDRHEQRAVGVRELRGPRKATPPKPTAIAGGQRQHRQRLRPASPSASAAMPGYPAASRAWSSAKTGRSSAAASPVPELAVSSKRV